MKDTKQFNLVIPLLFTSLGSGILSCFCHAELVSASQHKEKLKQVQLDKLGVQLDKVYSYLFSVMPNSFRHLNTKRSWLERSEQAKQTSSA
jgi:hypothetical protein